MNREHITFAFIIYYALEFSIITDIYRSNWILEIISFLFIINVSTNSTSPDDEYNYICIQHIFEKCTLLKLV